MVDWPNAVVPEAKIVRYLLDSDHPEGGSKAKFFLEGGFSVDQWRSLAAALVATAASSVNRVDIPTPYGVKCVMDSDLTFPNGVKRLVRTVWIVETGETVPRFVTAYPLEAPHADI
jgi:hypothetical protein